MTDRCIDRYASAAERRCAVALIDAILARGHVISVFDGGEVTVALSASRNAIMRALATTGSDTLRIRNQTGTAGYGGFLLVWQNCSDPLELICDHTANEVCDAIYNEVSAKMEKVAA